MIDTFIPCLRHNLLVVIDPNYLLFDVYDEEIHGAIRRSWLQQKVCNVLNKY